MVKEEIEEEQGERWKKKMQGGIYLISLFEIN